MGEREDWQGRVREGVGAGRGDNSRGRERVSVDRGVGRAGDKQGR